MVARGALADMEPFADGSVVEALRDELQHLMLARGEFVEHPPEAAGRLAYLLSNVLDPTAVMAKEYQPTIARLADGQLGRNP